MKSHLFKAGLTAAFIAASGPATAFTFNDAMATCLDCNIGLNDLESGDVFLLKSDDFTTSTGDFDIRVEIVRRTQPKPETIRQFNTTGASGFVQYRFNLVEEGSVTSTNLVGTTFDAGGQQFHIGIEDIDSNSGKDFTEYAGVDLNFSDPSPANIGTSLTKVEDFNLLDTRVSSSLFATETLIPGKPQFIDPGITTADFEAELAAFNFAYATGDPTPNDPLKDMDWTSVINTPTTDRSGNDPANTALFDLGTDREFDLIWGVSTIGDKNFTRGWNISLAAKPPLSGETPVPEIDGPVLVQVGFALAGLYVLMLGRRRREDDVEMRQAVA